MSKLEELDNKIQIKKLYEKIKNWAGDVEEDSFKDIIVYTCCYVEATGPHREDCVIENMRQLILLLVENKI